jgi:hypothetical protein
VHSITQTARDRVAVEVNAVDAIRTQWTLRYELAVVHRDRWYVRTSRPRQSRQGRGHEALRRPSDLVQPLWR